MPDGFSYDQLTSDDDQGQQSSGGDLGGLKPEVHARGMLIYNGMRDRGYDVPTSLGWAANGMVESPAGPYGPRSPTGARGQFQWLGSRAREFNTIHGYDPDDPQSSLDEHLDFVHHENQTSERNSWAQIQAAPPDPFSKARVIRTAWERPGRSPEEVVAEEQKAADMAGRLLPGAMNQETARAARMRAAREAGQRMAGGKQAAPARSFSYEDLTKDAQPAAKKSFSYEDLVGDEADDGKPQPRNTTLPPAPLDTPGWRPPTTLDPAAEPPIDEYGNVGNPLDRTALPDDAGEVPGSVAQPTPAPARQVAASPAAPAEPPLNIDRFRQDPGIDAPPDLNPVQVAPQAQPHPSAPWQTSPTETVAPPPTGLAAATPGALGRVVSAVTEGWKQTPNILTPKAEAWLKERGTPDAMIAYLNAPAVALGIMNAGFKGGQQGIQEALTPIIGEQGARDLAAMPEAFMGGPHFSSGLSLGERAAILRDANERSGRYAPAMRDYLEGEETPAAAGRAERERREAEFAEREAAAEAARRDSRLRLPGPDGQPEPSRPADAFKTPEQAAMEEEAQVVPPVTPDATPMPASESAPGVPGLPAPRVRGRQPSPPGEPIAQGYEAPPTPPPAPRAPRARAPSPYEDVPAEPMRLVPFLQQGVKINAGTAGERIAKFGLKDPGGDLNAIIGGAKGRPGLINNTDGESLDDAAERAWEAGYFPTRPDINQLLDAIAEDHNGNPVYSQRDQTAAQDFHRALAHNSEIDRLASEHDLPTKGLTRAQFFDTLADRLSLADAQRLHNDAMAEHQDAYEKAIAAAKQAGVDLEAYTPRTLEEMENEHRQADAAQATLANGPNDQGPPAVSGGAGVGEAGPGQGGRSPVSAGGDSAQGGAGPAVDLLGNPIAPPKGPRTAEPTIANDPNQIQMPGMGPSAIQAQAANDAKGPRSGQEPANAGLFAPPEIEQPSLPTGAQPPPTSSEPATQAAYKPPVAAIGRLAKSHDVGIKTVQDAIKAAKSPEEAIAAIDKWAGKYPKRLAFAKEATKEIRHDAAMMAFAEKDRQTERPDIRVPKPESGWVAIGTNKDGHTLFAQPNGVRSYVENGVRHTEPVQMRPTPQGVRPSVPVAKDKPDEFKVATPNHISQVEYTGPKVTGTTKGGSQILAPQPKPVTPQVPPPWQTNVSPPPKTRREYDKRAKGAEAEANRLTVDALNGDITAADAVKGLAKLVREGRIPEGVASMNLNRLGDAGPTSGEWEAAIKPPPSDIDEGKRYPLDIAAAKKGDPVYVVGLGEGTFYGVGATSGNGTPLSVTVQMPDGSYQGVEPSRVMEPDPAQTKKPEGGPKPEEPEQPQAEKPRDPGYGDSNKFTSKEEYEQIKARLRAARNRLNSGLPVDLLMDGLRAAMYHIEAGARKFGDFASNITEDIGHEYLPYLRGWYENARHSPGFEAMAKEMSSPAEIESYLNTLKNEGKVPAEAPNGVQGPVPGQNDSGRPEDVHGPSAVGETRPAPPGAIEESAPNAGGPVEPGAEGFGGTGVEPAGAGDGGGNSPGEHDGLPGPVTEPDAGTPGGSRPPDSWVVGQNHRIEPGSLEEARGPVQKARDNLAAIELAQALTADKRPASKEEQGVLAKYVGWGGLSGVFPNPKTGAFGKGLEKVGARLREVLSPAEYEAAASSTQNAHYTAEHVIRSMWGTVERMGFKGGTVFEPGMGVGHFLGLMPPDIASRSSYQGIEKDNTTAMIASLLYPEAGVRQADYVETPMPDNHFDLVIGNPPFADVVIHGDPKYTARNFMLHDYFFAKSLDSVRPGGLMAFVTSAGTMNKMEPAAREYLAERSEFVGGVRLPSSAFRQNAGTDVTTDVLFFKKRPARVPIAQVPEHETWTGTSPRELPDAAGGTQTGLVNNYFSAHPEMVLGREGFFDKLYKGRYAVHQEPILNAEGKRDAEAERAVLQTQFREALDRLPSDIMTAPPTPEEKAALDFASGQTKDGSFYINPKGELMQYRSGAGQAVKQRSNKGGGFTAEELARIRHLVPVRDALRDVFRADLAENAADAAAARKALNKHYDAFVAKFGPINKAEFQYRRPTIVQAEAARLEAREDARDIGKPWDDGDFDPSAMIAQGKTNTEIAKARQAVKERIEKSGKVFDEGSFDPEDMPDTKIEKRPNIKPFMGDPESYRMRSIEHYNDDTGKAVKKRIFRESVLTREEEPQINSAGDGLMWSLNKFGRMDLDQIAGKMGKSKDAIIEELGDKVFRVPGTTDSYQSDAEYLSGDVVAKLDQARAMLQNDPGMERNVRALEAALPPPLPPGEITMLLGMPWMPRSLMQDFASDHLKLGTIKVIHIPAAGAWKVEDVGGRNADRSGAISWGTGYRTAIELLSDAMNRTPPRITVRDRDGKTHFLPVETQEAVEKMNAINDEFQNWLDRDPDRIKTLAQTYNDALNRTVLRQFDGGYLTTPGISSEWRWRPHQTRVVARIIQTGNTYMAHAVGAGKTSAMIGAGMEMRRLGLVKKPMYVVPNHMLGQFTKEFYEQYPTARISVADEARFHTDVRRQFMSDVAQDDLDAVIITHSSFQKIPISREFEAGLIQEELDRLAEALEGLSSQEDRVTIKTLKNMQDKLRQKLLKANTKDKDETNTFEEMGVDFLFVDEAHMFRKLSIATKQGKLKGITATGSGMAWDLFTKIRRLEANTPGRAAVLASGTPVTNTMGELYNLSRYLQTPALQTRGIDHFDSWSQMFGTTKTELEAQPDGSLKPQTRFASFVNMPELYKMVGEVMDIVTPHQLAQYVTRPTLAGGERKLHIAPFTEQLADYQAMLGARMQAIALRKGPPKPGDDILLSVINDGRHAAIDPRFVMKGPADPRSKLNMMIDNVHRIWQETKQTQFYHPRDGYKDKAHVGPATQMIFMNLGVNGRGPQNFSGYTWIRNALRAKGIPANEIAIIGDYKGTVARQALFNDMNAGKVRILLGSVQKMGTGVNAQRLLIALHNLDPLWYPADDEQRVGRMLRQGNMNPEVQVHDYTTMDTYDRVMWQMMGRKGRFIEQFFRGDPELRHMEDLGEAGMFEQASAMTTSDPRVFRLTEMKQDLQAAQRRASAYEGRQYDLANQKEQHERWVRYYDKQIAAFDNDIARRQDTRGDKFRMRVGDKTYATRKEAAEALPRDMLAATNGLGAEKSMVIGEIGGFPLVAVRGYKATSEVGYYLRLSDGSERPINGQILDAEWSAGLIRSAESALRSFEDNRQSAVVQKQESQKQIPLLEKALAEPFKGAADIQRLRAEVRKLEDEMSGKGRPPGDYWPTTTPDWITPAMLNGPHMRDASVAWVHKDLALIRATNPQDAVLYMPAKRGVGMRGIDVDYDPPNGWPEGFPSPAELTTLRAAKKEAIASYFERAPAEAAPVPAQGWNAPIRSPLSFERDTALSAIERPRREMDEPGAGIATRGPLNRQPSAMIRRGAQAIINRLRLDTNLTRSANRANERGAPTISPEQQREIEDFINFLGEHMVSDVGLSIRQGPHGVQGQFEFSRRVVTLFKEAILNGNASRTMAHELWHAMERVLPTSDRAALTAEYRRGREKWLKQNEWARPFVKGMEMEAQLTGREARDWIERYDNDPEAQAAVRYVQSSLGMVSGVSIRWTRENYRYKDRSEYFAETMADRHFEEADIQNAKARSIWAHVRDIWRRMVNAVKRMFGRDQSGRIYEGFREQEYDPNARGGPLMRDTAAGEHDVAYAMVPGGRRLNVQGSRGEVLAEKEGFARAVAEVKAALAPTSLHNAKPMEAVLRKHGAEQAQSQAQAMHRLESSRAVVEKLTKDEQVEFTDRMEKGQSQPTPELTAVSTALRGVLDDWTRKVQSLGRGYLANAIDNYMGHIYSNYREWASNQPPPSAAEVEKRAGLAMGARRPLLGNKNFLKRRSFPTQKEAIDAGLIPLSYNPIDLQLMKIREMQRFYHGTRLADQMKESGMAVWVPAGREHDATMEGLIKLDDRVFQPRLQGDANAAGFGRLEPGNYYAPEAMGRLFNRYMSQGMAGRSVIYDTVRTSGNILNSIQLGFSGFHAAFVTIDTMISRAALGLHQLGRPGQAMEGMGNIALGAIPGLNLASVVKSVRNGAKLRNAWLEPQGATPEWQELAKRLNEGGGRIAMDAFYRNSAAGSFFHHLGDLKSPLSPLYQAAQMWRDAPDYRRKALVPLRWIARWLDTSMEPLMGHLVPRAKLGVFAEMAKSWQDAHPDATDEERSAEMIKIWDSVENRLGQMTYDDLYWHKALKDTAFIAVRSVGWNLGTWRELGGGVVDTLKMPIDAARGNRPEFTYRQAYSILLPIITGLIGGMMNYWMTGEPPQDLMDLYFPRTGSVDENGTPRRLSIPGYMKDVVAFAHERTQTLLNKIHPLASEISQLQQNKDYYGGIIYNPETDNYGAYFDYLLNTNQPFAWRSMQKMKGDGMSPAEIALGFWGFQPAPAWLMNPERAERFEHRQNKRGLRARDRQTGRFYLFNDRPAEE